MKAFGGDPLENIKKECYYEKVTLTSKEKCADESKECQCNGMVYYGTSSKYTTKHV